MPHNRHLLDPQVLKQPLGVRGQLIKGVLVGLRQAGTAEANLVRHNHAVTAARQELNGLMPISAVEVLAVQKQEHALGLLLRPDIHIGHLQRQKLAFKPVLLNWVRVIQGRAMKHARD